MKKVIYAAALLIAMFSFFFLWGIAQPSSNKNDTLCIVCTTSMLTDLVRTIVDGAPVHVSGLMGPGIDPHLYRARAGDVQKLNGADIIFFNGLDLEGKMGELFRQMSTAKKTVAVGEILDKSLLRQSDFAQMYDPHIWHDVALWEQLVVPVAEVIAQYDAVHAPLYRANAQRYVEKLQALDGWVKKTLSVLSPKEKILVTAHDAFGYFGAAYGFQVVGLQGISTDSEVGAYDIQSLAQCIAEHKVPALFVESSIPQRNIEAVQKAVMAKGWHTDIGPELYSDALGDADSNAGTYLGMIEHNVSMIIKALQKNSHE